MPQIHSLPPASDINDETWMVFDTGVVTGKINAADLRRSLTPPPKYFTSATRDSIAPDKEAQLGVETDTNLLYRATGLLPGNWQVTNADSARTASTADTAGAATYDNAGHLLSTVFDGSGGNVATANLATHTNSNFSDFFTNGAGSIASATGYNLSSSGPNSGTDGSGLVNVSASVDYVPRAGTASYADQASAGKGFADFFGAATGIVTATGYDLSSTGPNNGTDGSGLSNAASASQASAGTGFADFFGAATSVATATGYDLSSTGPNNGTDGSGLTNITTAHAETAGTAMSATFAEHVSGERGFADFFGSVTSIASATGYNLSSTGPNNGTDGSGLTNITVSTVHATTAERAADGIAFTDFFGTLRSIASATEYNLSSSGPNNGTDGSGLTNVAAATAMTAGSASSAGTAESAAYASAAGSADHAASGKSFADFFTSATSISTATGYNLSSSGPNNATDGSGLVFPTGFQLPVFSATLPPPGTMGLLIFVWDEVGGPVPAFFDGTNWRRVTDRAIISAT